MYNEEDIANLARKITGSKKYKDVHEKTVQHIVEQCLKKYEKNQVEKKTRNILHQICGSYYDPGLKFNDLFDDFKRNVDNGTGIKESIIKILSVQSSARERIPILDHFYRDIFSITGYPATIIDHACGLNPLSIFWMNLPENAKYNAFDIDKKQVNFLRSIFRFLSLDDHISVNPGDVLSDDFDHADIAFVLKSLPSLEQQCKGSSLEVIKKQQCRYMVISFPVKSLSGAEKGMVDFYSNWFENLIENESWNYERILFETELAFIVQK